MVQLKVNKLKNKFFKSGPASQDTAVQPPQNAPPPAVVQAPQPQASDPAVQRRKWHNEIKNQRAVQEYFVTGHNSTVDGYIPVLKDITSRFLTPLEVDIVYGSPRCDEILGELFHEHGLFDISTQDVALVSCISRLSIPASIQHLVPFQEQEPGRYLRCLLLAEKVHPGVLQHPVRGLAQILENLFMTQDVQLFQHLQQLVERLGDSGCLSFELLPLSFIQRALVECRLEIRLNQHITKLLETFQFLTLFRACSWLAVVQSLQNFNALAVILDQHFSAWRWLVLWQPNMDRITRWEQGRFSKRQMSKLKRFLRLDGPDNHLRQHKTLKLVEPHCYDSLGLHEESLQVLEKILNLLYRAHMIGPKAVDVFIHFCIEVAMSEQGLQAVEDAIRSGNSDHCNGILLFMEALRPQGNLTLQIDSLKALLKQAAGLGLSNSFSLQRDQLASRLSETMAQAQEIFNQQLQTGTGEYIGAKIRELGEAVAEATCIHDSLNEEFLSLVRSFPSQADFDAILERLENTSEDLGSGNSRLKAYLASTLGGQRRGDGVADSVTITSIQEEIRFWQSNPDSGRRDLAKVVAQVRDIRYALYTSWLHIALKEDDLFVREVTDIMKIRPEDRCLRFASYLAHRRSLNQMQNKSWLLLFAALIEAQGPNFLQDVAGSMPFEEWTILISNVKDLVQSVQSELPQFGAGLTQEQLAWWDSLGRNKDSVNTLLAGQPDRGNLTWLYFPSSPAQLIQLFATLRNAGDAAHLVKQITPLLAPGGSNLVSICEVIEALRGLSNFGHLVCTRLFAFRDEIKKRTWTDQRLGIQLSAWLENRGIARDDRRAIELVRSLLPPSTRRWRPSDIQAVRNRLSADHEKLLERASQLEMLRLKLLNEQPARTVSMLASIGVENATHGRFAAGDIPDDLADAVEVVGNKEYEISFILTGMGDLQRQAKGVPKGARLLIVRVGVDNSVPTFCVHFSPTHEGSGSHKPYQLTTQPDAPICDTPASLFTYHLQRGLHRKLTNVSWSRSSFSRGLQSIHSSVTSIIESAPSRCVVCGASMRAKLWKPSACGRICSINLRHAPLEVRLHNLLIDADAVDLLFAGIYAASNDPNVSSFLPNCPVAWNELRNVIDTFPALSNLQTATDLKTAIRGSDRYGNLREALISYLCLRFRGFLLNAPDKVPSMGTNVRQFMLVNSCQEKEKAFNGLYDGARTSAVVYHGTQISRLFPILCEGLKIGNGSYRIHGAAYGAGIYCGETPAVSYGYAGGTGQSWQNGSFSNMKVLLGCELTPATPPTHPNIDTHVITDENRLLVRYVFLVPMSWNSPPKHHIEPAMMTAFAKLRSGLQN